MAKKKNTNLFKKIDLLVLNKNKLIDFLLAFKIIDNNILLTINNDKLMVKTITETESIFKVGEIDFEDVFEIVNDENQILNNGINIGIFNIDKFTKLFSYLDEETVFTITCDDSNFSLKTEIKTKTLQKIFPSANKTLFRSLSDDQVERGFSLDNAILAIKIDKNIINKINNLLSLETHKTFNISYENNKVYFTGKEFKLEYDQSIDIINSQDEVTVMFDKNVFKYIEKDSYTLYLKEVGMLLFDNNDTYKIGISAADDIPDTNEDFL